MVHIDRRKNDTVRKGHYPALGRSNDPALDIVAQLIPNFLNEISKTFAMSMASGEAREKQAELQGQLCGVLTVRGAAGAGCCWCCCWWCCWRRCCAPA